MQFPFDIGTVEVSLMQRRGEEKEGRVLGECNIDPFTR